MPVVEWAVSAGQFDGLTIAATRALDGWRVRCALVPLWVQATCAVLDDVTEVRVVLEYDRQAGLVSYDAWAGDRRLYGSDDWTG